MRQKAVILTLVVLALLTAGLSAQVVLAQTGTPTAAGVMSNATGTATASGMAMGLITLGPGQSALIPANFWCLDFGKPFPTGLTGTQGVAPAGVTVVLDNAKAQGTDSSNPYQTQLAVWFEADGTYHDTGTTGHTLAQQLVSSVNAAATPAAAGQNLGTLAANGGLTVSVQSFQAVADTTSGVPPYHGTGNVMVQNTSSQTVSFVLDGAVFQPTNAGAQTMVAQQSGEPQMMAAGTTTAEPTTASAAAVSTAAATTAATATSAPTETPAPTATTAATEAPTATTAATVAPTATTAAAAAATSVTTATSTAAAMATPATLPVTGGDGGGSGWMVVLLLFGALVLFAGFGLGARRAQR